MIVICDVEADRLHNPRHIWVIVCKDVETHDIHVFRMPTVNLKEKKRFIEFAKGVSKWVGHNFLEFDSPCINGLIGNSVISNDAVIDTLVLSKLVDYSREQGHSLEDYGTEFGLPKGKDIDFSRYSKELEEYCVRDVEINFLVYKKYHKYITSPLWQKAIETEQTMSVLARELHDNGFAFNRVKAQKLLKEIETTLSGLDADIIKEFPPRPVLVREISPSLTKHGTLHKKDFKWVKDGDLTAFNGGPFSLLRWQEFNPSSHKQIVEVLNKAGWSPVEKTKSHIELEREISRLKWKKNRTSSLDLALREYYSKIEHLRKYGWKVNETNLATLPSTAPSPARTLAQRILLESRRRTLVEWLGLCEPKHSRIHGKFYAIGAWTHRMAHQNPNTANIPRDTNDDGSVKLYGKELRSLWQAPRNKLLVGVDAEGIQLRIFAHYIDDKEFTGALVNGKKSDKTDPHSLNQRILGPVCKTRQAAKRFIYSLLLGGGLGKLAEILGCSVPEAKEALERLIARYTGLEDLRQNVIPRDAKRGWFEGLDGRSVKIIGATVGERKHLTMSGYLQNGEAVVMKRACALWHKELTEEGVPFKFVNFVHDEWQTEVPDDQEIAHYVARKQAESLVRVGQELSLKCPLNGSYWNEDHKTYTIGKNWSITH